MKSSKMTFKLFTSIMAVIVMLLLFFGISFVMRTRSGLYDEKLNYLKEISAKSALNVQNNVTGNLAIVQSIATMIGGHQDTDMQHWLPVLSNEAQEAKFKRMGIVTKDGDTLATNGSECDFADREWALDGFLGKSAVSDCLVDKVDGEPINVFSAPIIADGTAVGVVFGTRSQEQFAQSMQMVSFNGEGYFYVINSDGEPIINTTHPNSVGAYTNLFKALEQTGVAQADLVRMHSDIAIKIDGSYEYTRDGERRTLYYTDVGVKDWYLVSVVASNVISRESDLLITELIALTGFVIALIILVSGAIIFYTVSTNKKLEKLAYCDKITGYPNWASFTRTAERLLATGTDRRYAIVICDINNFKVLNDIYGHAKGDEILKAICTNMHNSLDEQETFCRVSADNFNMLMKYSTDEQLITRLAQLESTVSGYIAGYNITMSFGIYAIDDDKSDIHTLSDRANISKTIVKKQQGMHYHFFKDENRLDILREKEIENTMKASLDAGEFKVYLQPKYLLDTDTIAGAEALVRWQKQENLIMPNDFIPLFEKNGFIRELDIYMFTKVCALLRKWQDNGKPLVPISINISRAHLASEALPTELADIAKSYNIPTDILEIELTESAVFLDAEHMQDCMRRIKKLGFKISIDDFGSGYSSLAALKDLPADVVKLDKSFLDAGANDEKGEQIIKGIIDLTHGLRLVCVAEGVETKTQLDFLKSVECDMAQGYYYSKPITIQAFEALAGI